MQKPKGEVMTAGDKTDSDRARERRKKKALKSAEGKARLAKVKYYVVGACVCLYRHKLCT